MTTKVDPQILRAFNNEVQAASTTISNEDTGDKVSTAADGLDGSDTQQMCQLVGTHVAAAEKAIADNVSKEGVAVRGVGDSFEVVADVLAGQFNKTFT